MTKPKPQYTERLPQVRISPHQKRRLIDECVKADYVKDDGRPDVSRYIRAMLFGDDTDGPPEIFL